MTSNSQIFTSALCRIVKCLLSARRSFDIILIVFLVSLLSLPLALSEMSRSIVITSSGSIIVDSIANTPRLHVNGNRILDAYDNTIVLRGVNKNQYEAHPGGYWNGIYVDSLSQWSESDCLAELSAIKSWGANVIRCHQAVDFWLYNVGDHRQLIQNMLRAASSKGIYVIYDGYAVQDYYNGQTQDPLPYPPYSTSNNAASVIPDQQTFVSYWTSIASTLKDYPNVIFEIWNEPYGGEGQDGTAAKQSFFAVTQQCINAIRATGAQNLIIAQWDMSACANVKYGVIGEGMNWISQANYNDTTGNLVYSTHLYWNSIINATTGNILNYYSYSYSDIDLAFEQMGYYSTAQMHPLIIGEFGCNLAFTENDLARQFDAYTNELELLTKHGISYCAFWWGQFNVYRLLSTGAPDFIPNQAGTILKSYLLGV
jgi:Cellulase (glycosyl hydrolase family 5)